MVVALASDHGGYDLKCQVVRHLKERGIECRDFGCYGKESCDYPDFGKEAAKAVAKGSIAANKVKGVRCALCAEPYSAKMTRLHNDANMLAMGGGIVGTNLALEIVDVFLDTPFSGEEKHARRIAKIED